MKRAKGSLEGPSRAYSIDANDQLRSAAEYRSVVVAYRNGAPVFLADIADVVDGAENVRLAAWMNEVPAVILNIQRQPGANVIDTVDRIKRQLPQLQAALPASIDVALLTDRTITIRASVRDVQIDLAIAIVLVVAVIFVFLRNISATLIPSVAVPLSLIGTFGVMYLAGFSINNLTLMALVVAAGFVVDDAIVVIENIARHIEAGMPPLEAALKGSREIGFTIISLTFSLIAVLIPLLFMGDVVGRLFREFAVTLAVAILISAVVSLTLTPMMCARLLKREGPQKENAFFKKVVAWYGHALEWVLERQFATLMVAIGALVLTVLLYIVVPKGFFPVQDTGVIQGISEAPQSVSLRRWRSASRRWRASSSRTRRWRASRPSSASTASTPRRTAAASSSTSSRSRSAKAARLGRDPAAAARARQGSRHHALHAAGAGPDGRGPRQPHAVPVHAGSRPTRRCSTNGCRS